jgi:PhnB protein
MATQGSATPGRVEAEAEAPTTPLPDGYHSVIPRIVVQDAAAQVEFLRHVFGAAADVASGRPAEVRIGDAVVLVSEAGDRDAFPAFLYIYVEDCDATWARAAAAGATTVEAPLDTPYGDRRAMVQDPFGNLFQIAHRGSAVPVTHARGRS